MLKKYHRHNAQKSNALPPKLSCLTPELRYFYLFKLETVVKPDPNPNLSVAALRFPSVQSYQTIALRALKVILRFAATDLSTQHMILLFP